MRLPNENRRWSVRWMWLIQVAVYGALLGWAPARAQQLETRPAGAGQLAPPRLRAQRFLAGRSSVAGGTAVALNRARRQNAKLLAEPRAASLSAPWTPAGPGQVASLAYGAVTGRVTAVAIDPADTSGNTVYVGTTGGGVWRSGNAAGPAGGAIFVPLTDTIPAFTANAGTAALPSLSIGALSVGQYLGQDVILAGTGDPNDATDSYYGSGILRSGDGGLTWTLMQQSLDGVAGNHEFFGLGFAGFAWSSTTPGRVVAALSQAAEGVIVNAPDQIHAVMGLYYSADAGVTWQMGTIEDGSQVVQQPLFGATGGSNAATAVVWNPVRQLFYAAVRFHGYYQSPDGVTWTRMASQPGTGLTLAACPTNPAGNGSTGCPMFRGALAVQPASGDTFAFSVDINNLDQGIWRDVCGLTGGHCATPAASFGTRLSAAALEVGGGNTEIVQGDYDLSLAAVAAGSGAGADTLVFAGTVDLYRYSVAAGGGFRNTTNTGNGCNSPAMVAPAQHALAVLAGAGLPLLYIGNDGGLWRSSDGVTEQGSPCAASDASHFENLNGGLGSLAEVVSFAQHPSDANTLLVGLGATGTASTASASTESAWAQLAQGEGGVVAIDPATPLNWYVSTGAGVNITYCAKGAACGPPDFAGPATIGAAQVQGDVSLVDAAWMLDPATTAQALVGTCRVWRGAAASGALWTAANALSGDFGALAGARTATCDESDPLVRSLAAGGPVSRGGTAVESQGSGVLYAGMAGVLDGGNSFAGHVFSTTAGSTASDATVWTDLAESPVTNDLVVDAGVFNPGGFDISGLVADAHDATGATVYATVMGFTGNGINAPHVYRSVDAGAHWTNISSNLPSAPANSVLVDPNDANTVYVAMDTGVYATAAVTSCTTGNCWSALGAGLPNAPVVELAAAAAMPTGDGRQGELRAATYGRGIWETPLLTASGPARPAISLNPAALQFAPQSVGSASVPRTITVTNTGAAALLVASVAASGDFTETDTCAGATVAVNQSCVVQIEFLPTAVGARVGVLTVYGNVSGGQATANLSGTGTAAASIVLDPLSTVFGPTTIGSTSVAQNITVSNLGATPATLGPPVVTGDFRISANSCGSSLASQVGCTVSIVFAPIAAGTRNGSFNITDSSGTQTTALRGTGTAPATDLLAPLTLSFAPQQLTTTSVPQTVTLSNAGDVALTLIGAAITSGDFTAVNSCGNSLSGHSSCTIAVAFVPKQVGQETGTLTVSDQFRSQAVALNGIGTAPPGVSLSPTGTLAFAATPIGQGSAAQTVTLTNNGRGVLGIAAVAVTGDFSIAAGGNGCGATLGLGLACGIQVIFSPTVAGPRTGTLTVVDSAGNSPQIEALTGAGIDFTLAADGSTDVTVASGGTAVYPLLLSSAAGVPGTATLSCTGAPGLATCVVQPSSVALGNTTPTVVTVTVATTLAALSDGPLERTRRAGEWLAVLLPLGLVGWRARRRPVLWVCVVACLLGLGGCGSARLIPASGLTTTTAAGGPGTPSGSNTLVVSATSAGLTRSVSLTLVVQ